MASQGPGLHLQLWESGRPGAAADFTPASREGIGADGGGTGQERCSGRWTPEVTLHISTGISERGVGCPTTAEKNRNSAFFLS